MLGCCAHPSSWPVGVRSWRQLSSRYIFALQKGKSSSYKDLVPILMAGNLAIYGLIVSWSLVVQLRDILIQEVVAVVH